MPKAETAAEDRQITCKDCGSAFTFTARSQAYFAQQGFPLSAAVRCSSCKQHKRQRHAESHAGQPKGQQDEQQQQQQQAKKKRKRKGKEEEDQQPSSSWWDALVERNQNKTRCFNCGKKGHEAAGCPKEKGSVNGCYRCGADDHRARHCPTAIAAAAAAKERCFNCGSTGHQAADCTIERGNTACYICGKEGHQARYCTSVKEDAPQVDDAKVNELVAKRAELRSSGDYAGADALRAQLLAMGVRLQDSEGTWTTAAKRKRPPRVCFAFQRGECSHGQKCHFEHVTVQA